MSIQVDKVVKNYGRQKALNEVSFTINSGEIVGFLGPNGAGKSTMMKIITTYIEPNSGSVKVNGFDIFDKGMDVKRSIGYLPEHNPLYLDFYVREYLNFHADIHKVDKKRIEEIINLVGLIDIKGKKTQSSKTVIPSVAVVGGGYWGKNLVRNFYTISSTPQMPPPIPLA